MTNIEITDDAPVVVAAAGASETFTFEAGTHNSDGWTGGAIVARTGDTYNFTGAEVLGKKPPISYGAATVTVTALVWIEKEDTVEDT